MAQIARSDGIGHLCHVDDGGRKQPPAHHPGDERGEHPGEAQTQGIDPSRAVCRCLVSAHWNRKPQPKGRRTASWQSNGCSEQAPALLFQDNRSYTRSIGLRGEGVMLAQLQRIAGRHQDRAGMVADHQRGIGVESRPSGVFAQALEVHAHADDTGELPVHIVNRCREMDRRPAGEAAHHVLAHRKSAIGDHLLEPPALPVVHGTRRSAGRGGDEITTGRVGENDDGEEASVAEGLREVATTAGRVSRNDTLLRRHAGEGTLHQIDDALNLCSCDLQIAPRLLLGVG